MEVVEEMLRKGKIKVAIENSWEWKELTLKEFQNIDDFKWKIKTINDTRTWDNDWIKEKTLFDNNWSFDEIAQTVKYIDDNLDNILINEYKLPLTANPWTFWKNVKILKNWEYITVWDITKNVTINWKNINLKLGWQYNINWNLKPYIFETLYP